MSVSRKSLQQINREKGLIFAKGFQISVSVCAGAGFGTGAGLVRDSVLEQPFHCFAFSGIVFKSFKFMPVTDILAVLSANSLFPSILTQSHSFRYKYEDADL